MKVLSTVLHHFVPNDPDTNISSAHVVFMVMIVLCSMGSRYGFGYPACPDLGMHETLWQLLEPHAIGISLTESMEMVPEQSTYALVVHHPQAKFQCLGMTMRYIYDPEKGDPDHGIALGIPFAALPDDWVCPMCYVSKDQFDPLD